MPLTKIRVILGPRLRAPALILLTTALVAGTAFAVSYVATAQSGYAFTPFMASKVVKHFSDNSPSILVRETYRTYGRRSDGSDVSTYTITSPDGALGMIREFTDLGAHKEVFLEPFTKSMSTYYLSDAEAASLRVVKNVCQAGDRHLAPEPSQILNYDVVHTVETTHLLKTEQWVVPALACFPLREIVSELPTGSHNEETVTSIIEAPPPDALFDTPMDFNERSPSQLQQIYLSKYPGYFIYNPQLVSKQERRYYRNR